VEVSDGHSRVSLANGTYSIRLSPGTYTVTASDPALGCATRSPRRCSSPTAAPPSSTPGHRAPRLDVSIVAVSGGNGNGLIDFKRVQQPEGHPCRTWGAPRDRDLRPCSPAPPPGDGSSSQTHPIGRSAPAAWRTRCSSTSAPPRARLWHADRLQPHGGLGQRQPRHTVSPARVHVPTITGSIGVGDLNLDGDAGVVQRRGQQLPQPRRPARTTTVQSRRTTSTRSPEPEREVDCFSVNLPPDAAPTSSGRLTWGLQPRKRLPELSGRRPRISAGM